ncbi:hypothetical protein HNY73_018674 [Argiope bruennichi]|uniref:Uncharacterized protein n=1 Tax=Argiope bruennichi TaxID=94029 RepID=A0A8T0EET7_ARGBR|nr:hypothetical protein HNY73_018674 [Argiope bruennichi]
MVFGRTSNNIMQNREVIPDRPQSSKQEHQGEESKVEMEESMGKILFPPENRRVLRWPDLNLDRAIWSCLAPPKLRAPPGPEPRYQGWEGGSFQDELTRALLLECISWKVKGSAEFRTIYIIDLSEN